jgi:four helix bundle protein
MNKEELKKRTKQFALNIIKLVENLPKTRVAGALGGQLVRAGTSVGANYRSACRARSHAEFISKIGIVEEEADESAFWSDLLIDSGISTNQLTRDLLKEAEELTAIFTATGRTAKQNR